MKTLIVYYSTYGHVHRMAQAVAEGVQAVAFSYLGSELTYPLYRYGTMGRAKKHLEIAQTYASYVDSQLSTVFVKTGPNLPPNFSPPNR